ncbi:Ca-activated chloride channel family protein [Bradyrhizobium sp. GM2.4]
MDTFDTTDSNEHPWLGRLIVVGLFLLAQGIAVMLVAFVALLVSFEPGWSATTEQASLLQPGDAKSGSLLLKEDGAYTEAIRLGIDVDITVSGPTLRARVTQIFRNPTKDWVEATYVYPLPADGAVDSLKMVVGNRVIVGDIKERQQARMIYEEARRAGQKAALTEQERPNIFTNSVANIGPGETVLVQIEYQEPVHQSGNEYSLRLPLVVGPRYNPAPIVQSVRFPQRWLRLGRDQLGPGAGPRPHLAARAGSRQECTGQSDQHHGASERRLCARRVTSPHHNVKVASPDNTMRIVSLADGAVAADRDFELTWKPAAVKAPSVGLFRERVGDADYLLAFVTPPAAEQATQKPRPREVIFVIDNSGSMGGTSIVQAKASLTYALSRLQPTDRFNVIRFDDTMDVLFPVSVAADAERVGEATSFVSALQARGGTEMVPAMRAALTDKLGDAGMVRQVVFLTDGAIGNEQQLFETITAMRGRSRVFMVGIGSAPNTYLMTRAAELGRGAFTHIGSVEQVEERMRGLFAKLENPAVTGLSVKFSEAKADVTPTIIPDVYRDEPLVLAAKLDTLAGSVEIKGRVGDRPWSVTLPLQNTAEGNGLSKLWAKRKIADAEVARTLREMTPEDSDKAILALALDHQIVTRLTSLVAVDKTPSRPEGEPLKPSELPINLPAGWDFAKVFGERQQVPAQLRERHADARNQPATRRPTPAAPDAIRLPKTATSAELKMTAGLILVVLALILFVFKRRQSLLTDAA